MQLSIGFCQKQGSVESSKFGSKFIALKMAMEVNKGVRYKLQMMGVAIDGQTFVFCNNQSVIANATRPESPLKKKSNAIVYHALREAVAMKEITICDVPTDTNVTDIMTKVLPLGARRNTVVDWLLWYISSGEEVKEKSTGTGK
jgi:hypothetical protein